jgi:uncharacterized membrane protein
MTYEHLAYLHLATVLPAFAIGTFQLARPKGTPVHRILGRIYLVLMVATAAIALFMPARVGPNILGHFGFIHLLCLLTLYAAPTAYLAARRGDIKSHSKAMVALYVGAILIAGMFAVSPGRLLHGWLFATAWSADDALLHANRHQPAPRRIQIASSCSSSSSRLSMS